MKTKWHLQVHGKATETPFEISVVNNHIDSAQRCYGWFNENKLLISHSGGPCNNTLIPLVWDKIICLAKEVVNTLNK